MQNRAPKPGEFYKHFKGKLYQIVTVAINSETGEAMVVYQALYGDFKTYVRPLAMFTSVVDHDKYPSVEQIYRFELHDLEVNTEIKTETNMETCKATNIETNIEKNIETNIETNKDTKKEITEETNESSEEENGNITSDQMVNPHLLRFLDASNNDEKLSVLISIKNKMNDRLLDDIATSLDVILNDGSIEERYEMLKMNLQTINRFESNRLR